MRARRVNPRDGMNKNGMDAKPEEQTTKRTNKKNKPKDQSKTKIKNHANVKNKQRKSQKEWLTQ